MKTKNRPGRGVALLLVSALIGIATLPAPHAQAAGLGYNVLQCHNSYRPAGEIGWGWSGRYVGQDQCQSPAAQLSIVNNGQTNRNEGGQFTLTAPHGTVISGIDLDANLRRGSHHLAQIGVWNGANVQVLAHGPDTNPSWQHYGWSGLHHPQLVMRLHCDDGTCPRDDTAHTFVRNINVRLTDVSNPSVVSAGGSLMSGGWKRGAQGFATSVSDLGSGINALSVYVNGTRVGGGGACDTGGPTWPHTGRLVPCGGTAGFNGTLNTAAEPFRNGSNTIAIGTNDYAGNYAPGWTATVNVDNANPSVAFSNRQDPDDPDLIRAAVADEHSGLAAAKLYLRLTGAAEWIPLETKVESGAARARVDSAELPPGEYEFRAAVSDLAGNAVESTTRQNGEAMRLRFPLREPVKLRVQLGEGGGKGQTVPYGTESKVSGRLLDGAGTAIAGKQVLVDENFGEGALIRHRPTVVTTDNEGRFESKVPAGPTRRITATFAGTQKYGRTDTGVGEFTVKSRASFRLEDKTVAEGSTASFRGKVGHVGARIPSGGKLVELQVRLKTGRWDTVGQAFRTDENGRYERQYRFGKHYTADALFRFRVKVQKERNWPYKRAASKQRKLIVEAR